MVTLSAVLQQQMDTLLGKVATDLGTQKFVVFACCLFLWARGVLGDEHAAAKSYWYIGYDGSSSAGGPAGMPLTAAFIPDEGRHAL